MNQMVNRIALDALGGPVDVLLADVAIRVQLSATDHTKAESRYHTINEWLERDGSPLQGRVKLLYPQGSMAIGATIASRLRTDEFDIDIIAELLFPLDARPRAVLDLLYESIRGEPGSRYYTMTTRHTRCVAVKYADDMHLDLTPAVLVPAQSPKTSVIFHHKPEDSREPEYRRLANPWGFAQWFKELTPYDQAFAKAYADRAMAWDRMLLEKAEAEPVPPQQRADEKSMAVIVHQLLKRWRNVRYDKRQDMRRPPSVMMAKLIADAANGTQTLSEELMVQALHLHRIINAAHQIRQKVHIENPTCKPDVLTDRWPCSLEEQAVFLHDLEDLIAKVARLRGDCDLAEMQAIMNDLFGENPTGAVFKSFNERLGQRVVLGQSSSRPGSGRLNLGIAGVTSSAAVSSPRPAATRPHTFYGSRRE
jgi:hypothetical protein